MIAPLIYNCFQAQLHELYVRYTMNPFSKLRSPIQSRAFDNGIIKMASSFNSSAMEQISLSLEEGQCDDGVGGSGIGELNNGGGNGLVWM